MVAPDTLSVRAWPSRDPPPSGEAAGRRRSIRPIASETAPFGGDGTALGPRTHSPPAWRIGPRVAPNRKFQTGWGRNLSLERPAVYLSDEDAISSPAPVEPKLRRLSVQCRSYKSKISGTACARFGAFPRGSRGTSGWRARYPRQWRLDMAEKFDPAPYDKPLIPAKPPRRTAISMRDWTPD